MGLTHRQSSRTDSGFTLVEMMVIVFIIGVLILVAMPVFYASVANTRQKTCFANQRTIDSAISAWSALNAASVSSLGGVINASHPLVTSGMLSRAPRCPSAPAPADPENPDVTKGAYSLDASGSLVPCTFGSLGTHGSYKD